MGNLVAMKAFVFPGQGSQFVGMGKDLYESNENARILLDKANELLSFDLKTIMFDGPEEDLRRTEFTQPALFVHSMMAFSTLEERPDFMAGHSLGEFSALCASGVFSFEQGLELVALRGRLMQHAGEKHPGTMAAIVGLDDAIVEGLCAEISNETEVVVAANYNCPGQLVVSGHIDAVKKLIEVATEKGAKIAKEIPVSGAFHSPLMESAKSEFAVKVKNMQFHEAKIPVVSNVTAISTKASDVLQHNIVSQLTSSVRWTQSMQHLIDSGVTEFVEVGAGRVLQGLVKRIDRKATVSGVS